MSLPRIAPYDLPSETDLPPAKVTWRLEPQRVALLIHDMQEYFVAAFSPDTAPITQVLANISRIRQKCHELNIPVFFTGQPGEQNPLERGLQSDFWGPGMSNQNGHANIVQQLRPHSQDFVLTKWRYSAFQRTTLETMLHARRCDQLLITGVYSHIGCLLTAADAFMRDIQPFFVADAVASFNRAEHDRSLAYVAANCALPVSTDGVIRGLSWETLEK